MKKLQVLSIRASKRAIMIMLCWTAVMLMCELLSRFGALAWLSWAVMLLKVIGVLIVAAFVVDYFWLIAGVSYMKNLHLQRQLDNNLPVYELSKVHLLITCPVLDKLAGLNFCLMDIYPENTTTEQLPIDFSAKDFKQHQELKDNQLPTLSLTYELYANERGAGAFGGVDWLIQTPLGLLKKFYHTPASAIDGTKQVRILANFKAVARGNLLALSKHFANGGVIKRKQKGQGQDFHQIRSYSEGDSIRHIDWKATSRYQRLMSKEYQDEADQEILFLLDCGQQMRHLQFDDESSKPTLANTAKVSHLDMALNAMLLLADVANRQADATGFVSFGANYDKIAPPKKGAKTIGYLLNQSFDLKTSMQVADYMSVARQALSMQKRRSLLIMITNIRSNHTDEIEMALQLLVKKHRVILVNLYESDLYHYLQTLPRTTDDALTYQSIVCYLDEQKKINIRLAQETGALVIGSTPEQLPQKLLDGYWTVRRFGVA